ncbi:MAG: peptidoglycan D,D-transpeptidase FtsI family protein [Acidimicrobiia bacterium]
MPSGPRFHFTAGKPSRRLSMLAIVMTTAMIFVVLKVASTQVNEGAALAQQGADQRLDVEQLAADRGVILDRTGAELALSVPQTTIWADPRLVDDPAVTAEVLGPVLGVDVATLQARLTKDAAKSRKFAYLARQVPDTIAEQVKALLAEKVVSPATGLKVARYPGVFTLTEPHRFYPAGDSGRSVIGSTDIDGVGATGVEYIFDKDLAGSQGELRREKDLQGRTIPVGESEFVAPTQGDDLQLTIDRSLQFFVEQKLLAQVQELGAKGGMAIVMQPKTGDVLAMASVATPQPTAETPNPGPRVSKGNFAVVGAYEPGSVNKVITAAAAVEEGIAEPDTILDVPAAKTVCKGSKDEKTFEAHDQKTDAEMSLTDIITQSSNTGTMGLAERIGEDRLKDYLRSFGLGEKTALNFPNEARGVLPTYKTCTSLQTMAIGQGLSVSPLQMAGVYATIANGGVYQPPRLVSARITSDGRHQDVPLAEGRRVVSSATAAKVTSMLASVVTDPRGTGCRAAVDGFSVAGKTGTAQKAQDNHTYVDDKGLTHYFSTFVGFAPAESPQIVVLAAIDDPATVNEQYYAGKAAAPLFRTIAQEALHLMKVPPRGSVVTLGPAPACTGAGDASDAASHR